MAAYITFTALNIWGVKQSAIFELAITILAVGNLSFLQASPLQRLAGRHSPTNPLPNGWLGVLPALPFAIWFYLAIEGIANVAEPKPRILKEILAEAFSMP